MDKGEIIKNFKKLPRKIKRLPSRLKNRLLGTNLKKSALVRKAASMTIIPVMRLFQNARYLREKRVGVDSLFAGLSNQEIFVSVNGLWDEVSHSQGEAGIARLQEQVIKVPPSLVTADFWDTLVMRTRPAEGVKRLTALRQSWQIWSDSNFIGQKQLARELHHVRIEAEATQVSERGEANIRSSLQETGIKEEFANYLAYQECLDETAFGVPTHCIIDSIRDEFEKFTVISDHYLSSQDLLFISEQLGFRESVIDVYSSADHGKTKRNDGELFNHLGLPKEPNWIHIGDNPVSDVKNAEIHGATALFIERKPHSAWNEHELDFYKLSRDLALHINASKSASYLASLSVLSFGLITFAIEKAIAEGKSKIAYLSREGEVLLRAHETAARYIEKLGGPYVAGVHLPVSRASTVFPSSYRELPSLLDALSRQYPTMSAADFHSSAGLPEDLLPRLKAELGPLTHLQPLQLWKSLSEELQTDVLNYLEYQHLLLSELLSDLSIDPLTTVLCDLGWRGSINDALSHIACEEFTGVYLGLYSSHNFIGNYEHKYGLLFDESRGFLPAASPEFLGHIEKSFTISPYQVAGYERDAHGHIKVQTLDKSDGPSTERISVMAHFEEVLETVANSMFSVGCVGSDSAEFVWETFREWTENPTRTQASTWYLEHHSEGFGTVDSLSTLDGVDHLTEEHVVNGMVSLNISENPWPSGLKALKLQDKRIE